MKTVIKSVLQRELLAKGLLFMIVPFIVAGCGGEDSANTISSIDNTINTPPPINTTPSIDTAFSSLRILENNGTTNYEINVSDSDGDSLTLSVESNNTSILTVTQNWTNPINQATYSAPLDFNLTTEINATGTVKITLTLSDHESNSSTSFEVDVAEATFEDNGLWKGMTYGTVTSPYTGKVWLDRNLGASQVCTALDDAACYGDYYQWGRNADGHQESNSTITATLSTDINSNGSSYITSGSSPYDWVASSVDDNGSLRSANWSKTDGSSVCPVGYRVPNLTELEAETTTASTLVANNTDAFSNFLKLPSAGDRAAASGIMYSDGSYGFVWSSSYSDNIYFDSSKARTYSYAPGAGLSVRCFKD